MAIKTTRAERQAIWKGPKEAWFRRGEPFGGYSWLRRTKAVCTKGHHPCKCGSGKKFRDCCRGKEAK